MNFTQTITVRSSNPETLVELAAAWDANQAEADPELEQDYGYCLGFLVGYVSGFAAREVGGEESLFCPPESAKIRDFMEAIQGWLVEHPEGLDKLGAYVAGAAFKWKFPCPSR